MQRILVANRGEIAVRIIHSIKKMGLETVALFHRNENKALHTRMADMAVSLGGGELPETYLNVSKIISIAKEFNCDAIHPGYGFLSENYQFARACEENGIVFIGPSSEVIRQMGSKSEARIIARKAGVPVLEAVEITKNQIPSTIDLKYPLIIKPALGGGGKGMKMVMSENDLKDAIDIACRESLSYFNNDNLIIEPYIENARHIEVQILGDNFGNIIHLFERECSIQRNHQKIIEEAPAVSISEELRNKLYKAAIKIAREIKYTNAGTVEFLVSGNSFYFLEMNTRIQVEHPVTEAITGIDIVEEQIRIAQNNPLSETLKHLKQNGHAIEARICAESSFENFRPSSGIIDFISFPTGPRVE
jgi:acetyl/propionyl-CoA carboxylase alpha subunit